MNYHIRHRESSREAFANYEYAIFKGQVLIAIYWHDYRGDESGIEFVNGITMSNPLGGLLNFVSGGGRQHPLMLKPQAIELIDKVLAESNEHQRLI